MPERRTKPTQLFVLVQKFLQVPVWRPRFHVYFIINETASEKYLAKLKKKVQEYFPAFDPAALDAARFLFGVDDPKVEFYEGNTPLNVFMARLNTLPEVIPIGQRNGTLSQYAAKVLKRYGDTEHAPASFPGQSPCRRERLSCRRGGAPAAPCGDHDSSSSGSSSLSSAKSVCACSTSLGAVPCTYCISCHCCFVMRILRGFEPSNGPTMPISSI